MWRECERSSSDKWHVTCYFQSVSRAGFWGSSQEAGRPRRARPDVVKRTFVMLQRIAVLVVSVGLVGSSEAICQGQRPLNSVVPRTQVSSTNTVATPKVTVPSLPDAPSASVANRTDAPAESAFERKWAFKSAATGEAALQSVASAPSNLVRPNLAPPKLTMVYETVPAQKESGDFLSRFLVASLHNPNSRYRASSNDRWMGRATDAASSILVTRDETGKRRLNASYLVGVLTSVAAHSASRPYWLRSSSAPIGDFGSTVGNDAGMNLMHEFGPGLREAVTGHMPSFVFRIEQRVTGERNPRPATSKAR